MHHEFQTEDFPRSFGNVWRRVMTEPRTFFQEMPVTGGLRNPLLFVLICLAISALGFLIFGPRHFAIRFIILGLVRAFVASAIVMVIARQVFAGVGDYEATFRAVAYSSAPLALLWLPWIGPLVILYTLFLTIVGVERVHGFDAVKAVLTLLLTAVTAVALSWVIGGPWWWYPYAHAYGPMMHHPCG
jgi:hypothetical protein